MVEIELHDVTFGIVVGADHWSLPYAIGLIRDAGIRDVLQVN